MFFMFSPFFVVGLVFLVIGIIIALYQIYLRTICTSVTNGIVIDICKSTSRDSDGYTSTTLHPVFQYNVSDKVYIKRSSSGSTSCKYSIGQLVDIYYNSQNPNKYYIKGNYISIILAISFIIFGIMLLVLHFAPIQ